MVAAVNNKDVLRKQSRETLRSLPLRSLSLEICQKLESADIFREAKSILFYWALADEISLEPLIETSLKQGKNLYLPKIDLQSHEISLTPLEDLRQIQPNSWGVYESMHQEVSQDYLELDVLFVPGLAYDRGGYRLGRGKGCYDRFLSKIPATAKTVGVIPEKLIFDRLNIRNSWDQAVKFLLSELGLWEVATGNYLYENHFSS